MNQDERPIFIHGKRRWAVGGGGGGVGGWGDNTFRSLQTAEARINCH